MVFVLFRYFDAREARPVTPEYPLAVEQENRLPPEPRLQINPRQDLADLRAREDQALSSYGWVDKNNRRRPHSDRRSDQSDARARFA